MIELVIRSYQEVVRDNGTPFPFATDSYVKDMDKVVKKYILNLQTLSDVEIALSEDKHLYEILRHSIRKLYIDIDHIIWTQEDIYKAVETILQHVKTLLAVETTLEDTVILCNEPNDGKYNSIHIIFNNISMHFECQKRFIQYINQTSELELDDGIYTNNRLLRCMGQSKMLKKERLTAFYPPNPTIQQTLVNSTQHIPIYTFKKSFVVPKHNLRLISAYELVGKCLHEGYDGLFNTSSIWCRFTACVSICDVYPLEEWLKRSAEWCPRYTYAQNQAFIHTIEDYPYDENYLFYLVNKYTKQDVHYIRTEHSQTDLESYLKLHFTDYKLVHDLITTGDRDEIHVFADNNIVYSINLKTAFITNAHGFKVNYHYDLIQPTEIKGIVYVETIVEAVDKLVVFLNGFSTIFVLKSSWGTGKTQHIFKRAVLERRFSSILVVTSSNSLNLNLTSILNAYLSELYYQEGVDPPCNHLFHSHLEKNVTLKQCKKAVCSIQSLHKIDGNAYDLVIIDEFESVINAFYAEKTFNQSPIQSFHTLRTILRNAGNIIALDADISKSKVDLLTSMVSGTVELYKNQTKSFQTVQFSIHDGTFLLYARWIVYEAQQYKLVLPSASRKKAEWIRNILCNTVSKENMIKKHDAPYGIFVKEYYDIIKHKKIAYIDCSGIYVYQTNGEYHVGKEYKNDDVYPNIDAFMQTHQIDIFIYTPTITTGISINIPHFDKCYSIASSQSVNYLEFTQMLMRNRIWVENKVNVFVGDGLCQPNRYNVTISDVLKSQIARTTLINQCKFEDAWMDQNEQDTHDLNNDHYCTAQIINMCNHKNTIDNFTYNFISVLKYHGLNYHWNADVSPLDPKYIKPESIEYAMAELQYNDWCNIPFLSFEQYMREYTRRANKYKLKPKLSYYQEHLYTYYEDADETTIESYYKTRNVIQLLNLPIHCKFIGDICQMADSGRVSLFERMDTLLQSDMTTYVNERVQDELNAYDVRSIWNTYIYKTKYKNVYFIQRFITDPSLKIKEKTYTDADSDKLNSYLLSLIGDTLGIQLQQPHRIQLTNKQFISSMTTLQTKLTALYPYIKEKDIQTKPTTYEFRKSMFHFIKERVKSLDYRMSYDSDKNTTREYDTMTIAPNCMLGTSFYIQYNCKLPFVYDLPIRFPYLQDKQHRGKSIMDIYKDVICLSKDQVDLLVHKLNQQKSITPKDKKALCKTLLLNEQPEDIAFQSYYHNDLYYMQYDPNLHSFEHTYYSKSRNQKKCSIELYHATVNTYVPQSNAYVKSNTKVITQPYIPKAVTIPHKTRPPCLDFLFNRSNVIMAGRELKSTYKLKSKFMIQCS